MFTLGRIKVASLTPLKTTLGFSISIKSGELLETNLREKVKSAGGLALPARHLNSTSAPAKTVTICPNSASTVFSFDVKVLGKGVGIEGETNVFLTLVMLLVIRCMAMVLVV